ncbi:MAG: hypothetical protein ABI766_15030, partial [Gemmatimonadales bacterium]
MFTPRVTGLLLAAALAADVAPPLRVIRALPEGNADPGALISVTFDRPVAGSLDRSVDPKTVLILDPVMMGIFEWRDPVTLRFRPATPMAPGLRVKATVRPGFAAMDGSTLAEPYQFEFRVGGPRVLTGIPANPNQTARFLPGNARFQIVLSGSADPALLSRLVYVEMNRACATPGVIQLKAGTEAPIPDDAPWQFKEAGGYQRERSADALRRVVTLTPERPLPYGCSGDLVMPEAIDAEQPGKLVRWSIETYGKLELTETVCRGETFCPNGPFVVTFSTPVKGAELLKHLTVLPKVDISIADTADVSERWIVSAPLKPRTGYLVRVDSTLRDSFGQSITGYPVKTVVTTGYRPDVSYPQGKMMVERVGRRTFG